MCICRGHLTCLSAFHGLGRKNVFSSNILDLMILKQIMATYVLNRTWKVHLTVVSSQRGWRCGMDCIISYRESCYCTIYFYRVLSGVWNLDVSFKFTLKFYNVRIITYWIRLDMCSYNSSDKSSAEFKLRIPNGLCLMEFWRS